MSKALEMRPERLFSSDPTQRAIALRLHREVEQLPIISPHGHTDPRWFAENQRFANPTELLIQPDHYVYRMLYSQGIGLDTLGIRRSDGSAAAVDPRAVWRLFAEHYHLFRGTPSAYWLNYVFSQVFGLEVRLNSATADLYYDTIDAALATPACKPRALFERYNIEVLATTESPLDTLEHHRALATSGWSGRVITAFRPDPVLDPDYEGFRDNLAQLGDMTGSDCFDYAQYLDALRQRRAFFKTLGATSTDHGHPTAKTADLTRAEAEKLFARVTAPGPCAAADAELFRAHMLVEMAAMSLEDGLVLQIHPGASRNHNAGVFARYGRDKGADIPMRTNYVADLKPLLDRYGNETALSVILFTLDESNYSRELAPLAGHYPMLKLGPPWWFHDSPEGMLRFRRATHEVAGFANVVGFNDDTRAFLSIPARHDMARRMDCVHLAELVASHRLEEDEAAEIIVDLSYSFAKAAYKL
ncbi:glucuronate isomerase [Exilibacterium tricleocarpae]|uniref:Uronate isomerase n=1 Tax=Exilibacterium tricleocarpae TaxID=2591008 RepID=A0A545U6L4_9GAMM|nr:glucuronate isomerase [Exilibacterium tricleocarpae]TQV85112.1 glucuronate isomerase [Exilibacterium tricleocarpae]